MDLLLTHGYFLYENPKELQIMKPYVPLGILYLSSHLRARNFDVEIFDTTFASRQELLRLLQDTRPAVLGVYANLMTRGSVVQILRAAKEAGWRTVVGGPEPGAYVEEYLAAGADVVVIGEGEITLEELLPRLRSDSLQALHHINGIAFRGEDGKVRRTPPRSQIPDIDRQPWPSRESVPMERYIETWRQHHGTGSVSIITASGSTLSRRQTRSTANLVEALSDPIRNTTLSFDVSGICCKYRFVHRDVLMSHSRYREVLQGKPVCRLGIREPELRTTQIPQHRFSQRRCIS